MINSDSFADGYVESQRTSRFERIRKVAERVGMIVGLAAGLTIGAAILPEGTPPHDIGERVPVAGAGVEALHEFVYGDLGSVPEDDWREDRLLHAELGPALVANDAAVASGGRILDSDQTS